VTSAAKADVEHVVVARRALVFDRRLAHVQVAAELRHGLVVRHSHRAPIACDGCVEVHQVVPVEDDLLQVDLDPAHTQPLHGTELAALHY
jgi:hypothetical protein